MTYLEIVNDVLKRLREPTVSSVSDTEYSLMIGTMVNDAKRDVENAHTWNSLRSSTSVTTVAATQEYELSGMNQRFVFDFMVNNADGSLMEKAPISWIEHQTVMLASQGQPNYFSFSGQASNGNLKIKLFPIPNDVYNYTVFGFSPTAALSTNTDVPSVPDYLIALNAYARAIAERGEDSGNLSSEAYQLYQKSLGEAIAIERNRYEEQVNWEAT